jgi:hypothetical protein
MLSAAFRHYPATHAALGYLPAGALTSAVKLPASVSRRVGPSRGRVVVLALQKAIA